MINIEKFTQKDQQSLVILLHVKFLEQNDLNYRCMPNFR
jgi:hypothetical protein